MGRSKTKYPDELKKVVLEKFKELRLDNEVESLNHFIDIQKEIIFDYPGKIPEIPYPTVYRWITKTDKYKKYKSLMDKPVAQRKNHKEKEDKKKDEQEEQPEEKEDNEKVELKKKIDDLPRKKTVNKKSKNNLPVEEKKKIKTNKNTILTGFLGAGFLLSIGFIFFKKLKGGSKNVRSKRESGGTTGNEQTTGNNEFPTIGG